MRLRVQVAVWVGLTVLGVGLVIFLVSPYLFASISYPLPDKYRASVAKWAQEYGISPNFLAGLIMAESGWKEGARSHAGAIGMTQFIPSTAVAVAKRLGVSPFKAEDLTKDPDLSIRFGAYYISSNIKNYGDAKKALIAYNGGGGAVNAYERGTPVRGTVAYANKILSLEKAYGTIYGQWWKGGVAATPTPAAPGFTVAAKPDVSELDSSSSISIIDFWKTLLSAPASNASEDSGGLNDLWRTFVPGS